MAAPRACWAPTAASAPSSTSLADLVSFGVAPGVIMYMWSLKAMGNAGWIAALIFCACAAIRLARFNVESVRDEGATKGNPYFTGLPTPAAACMMLLPLLVSFQWNDPAGARTLGVGNLHRRHLGADGQPHAHAIDQIHEAAAPAPDCGGHRFRGPGRAADRLALGDLTIGLLIYVASIPFAIVAHHPRYATKQASYCRERLWSLRLRQLRALSRIIRARHRVS